MQDPDTEVFFINRFFRALRKRAPLTLREDFCGTALLCATWVKSLKGRTAQGIDFDKKVLAWGVKHNLAPLAEDASRIKLLCFSRRARMSSPGKHDVVCAFNFSYWIFKTTRRHARYFTSSM